MPCGLNISRSKRAETVLGAAMANPQACKLIASVAVFAAAKGMRKPRQQLFEICLILAAAVALAEAVPSQATLLPLLQWIFLSHIVAGFVPPLPDLFFKMFAAATAAAAVRVDSTGDAKTLVAGAVIVLASESSSVSIALQLGKALFCPGCQCTSATAPTHLCQLPV